MLSSTKITPRVLLFLGLAVGAAVQLWSVWGGWYLDSDDWYILRMGREVVEDPQWRHFFGFWSDEPIWRPALTGYTALEYALFEDAYMPRVVLNLALHIVCALMVFLAVRAWFGDAMLAAWTALLFFAHPMHGEALAWFHSGNEGIVVAIFSVAADWAIADRPPLWVRRVGFQLAMLSRESAGALPAIITLGAYVRADEQRIRRAVVDSAPFWAVLVFNIVGRLIAIAMVQTGEATDSFHLADNPIVSVVTMLAHPWAPTHPGAPLHLMWLLAFGGLFVALAIRQRGRDRRFWWVAFAGFVLAFSPVLPNFHGGSRFLNAWAGGVEQRWYFWYLPLAFLMIWPASLLPRSALIAVFVAMLCAQSINAQWWRDHGAYAHRVFDDLETALEKRPRAITATVHGHSDHAEIADTVLLNLPVILPDVARRGVAIYHCRSDGPEPCVTQKVVTSDRGQVSWQDVPAIPPYAVRVGP